MDRFGWTWFIGLYVLFACSWLLSWFDNSTELTPDHGDVLSMCFALGALAALISAGVGLAHSEQVKFGARIGLVFAFVLMGGLSVTLLMSTISNIVVGMIDFPPGKTWTYRDKLPISRAYQTHGKGRSWNIQTMPIWSNLDITQDDYKFMLAHRRPGDPGQDPDEISSNGYFCAQVTVQQAGDAYRVMHAGAYKLPKGTVIICPPPPATGQSRG